MVSTSIMECYGCKGLFLAGNTQKTKLCPYCGKSVNLQKSVRIVQMASSFEASEVLKQLKAAAAQNSRSPARK